jgi:hypothetical protein
MPYVVKPPRRARRSVLAGITAALACLAVAAPAPAATPVAGTSASSVCVPPLLRPVFLPWGDFALYTLSPGGDFEGSMSGWQLAGGARVVSGNEPYHVGSLRDDSSLSIPAGASAVSAPICIDRTYPTFRFFARNLTAGKGKLSVEVSWQEAGITKTFKASLDKSAGTTWAPVKSLKLPSGALSTWGLEPVTFRFTADTAGAFEVDDVYVDPFMRR